METTLEYLIRNYEKADDDYYKMQAKADHQIAIANEAHNLADSYRKAQEECSAGREKYLKMIQELDPNFIG